MTRSRSSALRRFLSNEAAGGIVLIAAAVLALVAANSSFAGAYFDLLHAQTGPVLA
nr:Na+/H+ antiporter NhaA [Pseudomonadota bacterium]